VSSVINVAFVGAGYMAREHIRAFHGLPDVRLAGIFSRTKDRAAGLAAEFSIPHVCDSVADLYTRTEAELVVVTVRELAMKAVAAECFRYSWIALLEKPAGYNLPDAEAILAGARASGSRVFVALNRRSYASTRLALDVIGGGGGSSRLIVVNDQQDIAAAAQSGQPPEVVRNYMFANSIHVIDYLRVFGRGAARKVVVISPWNPERPGFVVAGVEFDSGDTGVYQGTWDGPGPWAVSVSDSQRRVEMRPLESLTVQMRGERRAVPQELGDVDTQFKPGLRVQAMNVVAAARTRTCAGLATLEDATASMRLCARIFGLHDGREET
jgi:predicted dehydrogenase